MLREKRIPGRVKSSVAQTGDAEHDDEDPERTDPPRDRKRAGAQKQSGDEDKARAHPVDQKAGRRLHYSGNHVEGGEREPKLGVARAVTLAYADEERRQQHDVEVADEMRKAHAADELVLGVARGWKQKVDGLGHDRGASASRIACHTRQGVAGMSIWRMP